MLTACEHNGLHDRLLVPAGDRLKEGIKINLSLTALGNVISALVDSKSGHVPYRSAEQFCFGKVQLTCCLGGMHCSGLLG